MKLGQSIRDHDIAVIGMSGRFPGAADLSAFWANLAGGVEAFTHFTDDELRESGVDEGIFSHPDYVKVRPVLDDISGFDSRFFGYSPREAELTDPQQRIFLECVWEVLENSGYGRSDTRGRVGLFAGANISTYLLSCFMGPNGVTHTDPYELVIGNDKDALATVIAYRLDLTGPVAAVQTFCSTSAAAAHLACQSLRRGECEIALAGGVSVRVPPHVGHMYFEGGMESPDGHIRTFDARAQGGVFGDGAGVIALKPLHRALEERDTVYAVIRGSAMNNDGASKFSYTAPSVVGQSRAVEAALTDADVSPRDISYVEAHGTATELGDPIEVAALTRAFKSTERARGDSELTDRNYCAIGSVKPNIGHLDRAATVAGLIKVIQALRHEEIPQSLHFDTPNPEIDFARSPFFVAGKSIRWKRQSGKPRLAGVNGLGMGGTNVHMVVQEAPKPSARPADPRRWHVLPLSAQTEGAAQEQREHLAKHLKSTADAHLTDAGYTLQTGRSLFAHRQVCVASSPSSAAAALEGATPEDAALLVRHDPTRSRRVAFILGGVGEHYVGMVGDLYRTEPAFRGHLDRGIRFLAEYAPSLDVHTVLTGERAGPDTNGDLAALLGRRSDQAARPDPMADTRIAQPAVFLAEYALAATLMNWGIKPAAVLGYSVGEYVAACLSGVLTFEDALRLVVHRACLIGELPGGAMLAVGLTWDELRTRVPDLEERGIDLGAVTPGQVVAAGPVPAVGELAALLRAQDVVCRPLSTTHAFHSRMLRPKAEELTSWVAEHITLKPPALSCISNVTGEEMDAESVMDPGYWARHMCSPVRFEEALGTLLRSPDTVLLEVGPGRSLGAMARAHSDCDRSRWPLIASTLPAASEPQTCDRSLAQTLGELWLSGVDIDWEAYHRTGRDFTPGRIPLPTYPFQRQEYWYDSGLKQAADTGGDPTAARDEYGELPMLPDTTWMHLPVWRQRLPRRPLAKQAHEWTVYAGDASEELVTALAQSPGIRLTLVRPGERFAFEADGCYRIRPGNTQDTLELFTALKREDRLPERVLHLWTLENADTVETVERGTHALVALARASHEIGFGPWTLDVVTAGVHQVTGGETIRPERATVLGPCTIIPVECPGATLRSIDVVEGEPLPVAQLLGELRTAPDNQTIALRGGKIWIPEYESLELPAEDDTGSPAAYPRDGGVYLITGGLGGIGLELACLLASEHRAKLVLMGRTPVPPSDQWDALLRDSSAAEEVRRRIEGLRRLSAAGGEFVVVQGDVSVTEDVERAVAAAEQFGGLHGVLHAAGVPGIGMMQFKSTEDVDRVLAPKVAGTLALAQALKGVPLDFVALFSSVSSVTGALGQADYSAANAFLDAFAHSGQIPQTRVVSIGWGEWEWNGWESGLDGYEPVLRHFYEVHRQRFGIDFDDGWRYLLASLARSEPHLFISTQNFGEMVRGSREYTMVDIQEGAKRGRGDQSYPRPDLSTPYVPPRTEPESVIAGIWADALGIEQVGVHDNFFDLGGNSLLGVGIIAAVRRSLELEHLPAYVIYQTPTVAGLAAGAAGDGEKQPGPSDRSAGQAESRAKQRQQRLARLRATQQGGQSGE